MANKKSDLFICYEVKPLNDDFFFEDVSPYLSYLLLRTIFCILLQLEKKNFIFIKSVLFVNNNL